MVQAQSGSGVHPFLECMLVSFALLWNIKKSKKQRVSFRYFAFPRSDLTLYPGLQLTLCDRLALFHVNSLASMS